MVGLAADDPRRELGLVDLPAPRCPASAGAGSPTVTRRHRLWLSTARGHAEYAGYDHQSFETTTFVPVAGGEYVYMPGFNQRVRSAPWIDVCEGLAEGESVGALSVSACLACAGA
jgi:hypothetical protein